MEEGMPAAVSRAVNHRLRRRILRRLHESAEPLSPARLARRLHDPPGAVSYHVKVLRGCEAVARVDRRGARGPVRQPYSSLVADDPEVTALLDRTREADEPRPGTA